MKKKIVFMMSRNVSGICILQVILLCAWMTLLDSLKGLLMDLMGFMDCMA